jgi:hypothetical protein
MCLLVHLGWFGKMLGTLPGKYAKGHLAHVAHQICAQMSEFAGEDAFAQGQ